MMKLFDSHCHLQDARILARTPQLIASALDSGVLRFAVNGVSEKDWHLVKQMSDDHSCVIPCFGLHPWYVAERTPLWFSALKDFFQANPSAAVGEIGLDKGSHGRKIDFDDQVEVFKQQLELAKELNRPVSVHCVKAFGDLLPIMRCMGPFPAGVILHSYLGSAEMVPEFAKFGAYFSFSGFLMPMEAKKAKKMLKRVPRDKILLESDAPDALPKTFFERDASAVVDPLILEEDTSKNAGSPSIGLSCAARDSLALVKETLNHPANIHEVLRYVASLLEMPKEELAELTYRNAMRLFSYDGSKVTVED